MTHEVEAPEVRDLDEAKEFAEGQMSYTQENVYIIRDGEKILVSRWYGVEPDDDSDVLMTIADGYYEQWSEPFYNE